MFTVATVLNALELGFIYALVAMALFLSFRVLNTKFPPQRTSPSNW